MSYKKASTKVKHKAKSTEKSANTEEFATQEVFESLENTAQSTEHFLEKNAKVLGGVFGVLILIALGYFAYLKFYQEPRNTEATNEIATADEMFKKDSLASALNGSAGSYLGYTQIIEDYSGTDAANMAKFKAGVALYKEGKFQEALDQFNSFDADEVAMKVMKEGAKGDALVQLGKKEEGLNAYENAVNASQLEVLQKIYTKKAAVLALDLKAYDRGVKTIEAFLKNHPDADNNGDLSKLKENLIYAK